MEKCAALLNAQNVWAWAVFFGLGSYVSLSKFNRFVQLEIHFPFDKYIKDSVDEQIRKVTTKGADFRWDVLSHPAVDILYITWSFE